MQRAENVDRTETLFEFVSAPDVVCNAVLHRLLKDISSGVDIEPSSYMSSFPGYETLVGVELERLGLASGDGATEVVGEGPISAGRIRSGTKVGRYRIDAELAAGGMGVVYLATDATLGRRVVLKTALPEIARHPDAARRLRQEARLAGRLDHPSICPVLDVVEGDTAGQLFIVQPFIPGTTMDVLLKEPTEIESFFADLSRLTTVEGGPAETAEPKRGFVPAATGAPADAALRRWLVGLMSELARAMAYAHDNEVIHRDLKPSNIMVRPDGRPVVLDFGLARDLGADAQTVEGSTLGTPSHMAPEQVEGRVRDMGPRTDVYAMGIILYRMLTGQCPYRSETREGLYRAILDGRPKPIRDLAPDVSKDLEAVCLKAMERDSAARFATATEFADELDRILSGEPTLTRPLGPVDRTIRLVRRHPWRSSLAAATVLLAFALGVVAMKWRDAGETVDVANFYLAYEDAMDTLRREKRTAFTEAERERLREVAGGRPEALFLIENPDDPSTLRRIRQAIRTGARSKGAADGLAIRPFGHISNGRPEFVFPWPGERMGDGRSLSLRVVRGEEGRILEDRSIVVSRPASFDPATDRFVTFALPESEPALVPGHYEWQLIVTKTEGDGEESMIAWSSPQHPFVVRPQPEFDEALPKLPASLPVALRSFFEATSLHEAGFDEAALDRLGRIGTEASAAVIARAALLRGAIALRLGDLRAADEAFRRARAVAPPHRRRPMGK